MFKYKISGVRKKKRIGRKVPEGKMKMFAVEICDCEEGKKMNSGIFIYWVCTHWLGAVLIETFNHMG